MRFSLLFSISENYQETKFLATVLSDIADNKAQITILHSTA